MALSALTTWEVRNGGSDTNGGGFKTGASGTDWTLQDAAQYSVTDAVTNGTTTITSATANFGTDVVGNILYIQGGTAPITAGWYEITVRTNSTTITVDRSTGLSAGTGATLKIGGGFASPGQVGLVMVSGNDLFIKYNASAYVLTTASANVSGGVLSAIGAADRSQSFITGYDSTRTHVNTDANRPTIQIPGAGVTSCTVINAGGLCITFRNIIVDGNSKTSIRGFDLQEAFGGARAINCKAMNCTDSGFVGSRQSMMFRCEATGCSGAAGFYSTADGTVFYYCYSHDNTVSGFFISDSGTCSYCISESNTGGSSDGFTDGSTAIGFFEHCTAYNNGRDGFRFSTGFGRNQTALNCVAYSNTGTGYNADNSSETVLLINSAYGANGTNVSVNITAPQYNSISLSGDPFADAANGNFALNNTAGAGADLRAASYPSSFAGSLTNQYLDVGAVQHQDSGGGGGGALLRMRMGMGT